MSGIKTIALTEDENQRLRNLYRAHRELGQRYIRTDPGNQVLAYTFEKYKDKFSSFKIRSDDVFVFGWPKNGSVWLAEMAWCINNGFDVEKAGRVDSFLRFPFIEFPIMAEAFKHALPTEGYTNILDEVSYLKKFFFIQKAT